MAGWAPPWFPASSTRVGQWIAHEAHGVIRKGGKLYRKTLKRKVQALASWHKDLGMEAEFSESTRVDRIIKGANRLHGICVKDQPLPITLPILRRIVSVIRDYPLLFGGHIASLALVAAFTLGFACFLRMGELTFSTFYPKFDLQRSSIGLDAAGQPAFITLKASKTDPFRIGVTTTIPTGPADVCPVRALRRWMLATRSRSPSSALFTLDRSSFIKRTVVGYLSKALMEAGYPASRFTGHSLRRGAATWASSIGMSAQEIQTLGRWNSDCYKLYIDAGPEHHRRFGARLLTASDTELSLPSNGLPTPGQVWRPAL